MSIQKKRKRKTGRRERNAVSIKAEWPTTPSEEAILIST
jgi:hypothetical protein